MPLKITGIRQRGRELFYEVSADRPLKRLNEWQRELRIRQVRGVEKLNLTLPGPAFLPSAFQDYFARINLHRRRMGQPDFVRVRFPETPDRSLPEVAPLPVWRARSGPGLVIGKVHATGPHGTYHAGISGGGYSLVWPHGLPHDLTHVMHWNSTPVECWLEREISAEGWDRWLKLLKPGMSLTVAGGERFDSIQLSVSLDEGIGPTIQIGLTRGKTWLGSPGLVSSLVNELAQASGLDGVLCSTVDKAGVLRIPSDGRVRVSQPEYDSEECLVGITIGGFADTAECERSSRAMRDVLRSQWTTMRIDAQIAWDVYSHRRPHLLALGEDWQAELCGCYGAVKPLERPKKVSETIRWPYLT